MSRLRESQELRLAGVKGWYLASKKEKPDLQWLQQLNLRAEQLHSEREQVIERVRSGFVDRVVLFMDVVGSTKFKVEHANRPEVWILRVLQFSELLATAVRNAKGVVVKYIGDEVMATFENVFDAQNLVARVSEIEENLAKATGFETRIKVAADFGKVYELKFEGHESPDPQGSAVDRCARISKFGQPGEVLASAAFAEKTPGLSWQKLGPVELKGLGSQTVYQLVRKSVDLKPIVEVSKESYEALQAEASDLRVRVAAAEDKNRRLQEQLTAAGEEPDVAATIDEPDDETWAAFEDAIRELNKTIKGAPTPQKYARFIFLECSQGEGARYDSFKGSVFDELIEANLVRQKEGALYRLATDHPRTKKALALVEKAQAALKEHLGSHERDEDDLFEWDMTDAAFWQAHVGHNVLTF
jgi:class 3 adenylate cyclase